MPANKPLYQSGSQDRDQENLRGRISVLELTQLRLLAVEENNAKILFELAQILKNPGAIPRTVQS
jgi:hypothetical protein